MDMEQMLQVYRYLQRAEELFQEMNNSSTNSIALDKGVIVQKKDLEENLLEWDNVLFHELGVIPKTFQPIHKITPPPYGLMYSERWEEICRELIERRNAEMFAIGILAMTCEEW